MQTMFQPCTVKVKLANGKTKKFRFKEANQFWKQLRYEGTMKKFLEKQLKPKA